MTPRRDFRRYPPFGAHVQVLAFVQPWLGYPPDPTLDRPRFARGRHPRIPAPEAHWSGWSWPPSWPGQALPDGTTPLTLIDVDLRWRRIQLIRPVCAVVLRRTTRADGFFPEDTTRLTPTKRHRLLELALAPEQSGRRFTLAHPNDLTLGWANAATAGAAA